MLTIFRLTMREVMNKKIFLIAAILSVIFLILFGLMLNLTVKSIQSAPPFSMTKAIVYPQLFTMGLYFACFLVNLFAIFLSVGALSSEIENGIMQAIVPKPVRRSGILLGKYLGYCFTLIAFGLLLFSAIFLLTKAICGYAPDNLIAGAGMFILQPLILMTLTMWGSAWLSTMANGITIIMLYVLATVGGMAETVGGFINNKALLNTGIITSLLVPTDAAYRKMVSVMVESGNNPLAALSVTPFGTGTPPSGLMVWYMFVYIGLFLLLAVWVFGRRNL